MDIHNISNEKAIMMSLSYGFNMLSIWYNNFPIFFSFNFQNFRSRYSIYVIDIVFACFYYYKTVWWI